MRRLFALILVLATVLCLVSCEKEESYDPSDDEIPEAKTLVSEGHTAAVNGSNTVDDPINAFCGNTQTSIYVEDGYYTFMGGDSVALTEILSNLKYDEDVCKCRPDFYVRTEFGGPYGVSLDRYYARSGSAQKALTEGQAQKIRAIYESLDEKDKMPYRTVLEYEETGYVSGHEFTGDEASFISAYLASLDYKTENTKDLITELTVTANLGDVYRINLGKMYVECNKGAARLDEGKDTSDIKRIKSYLSVISEREQRTDMPTLTVTCGETSVEAREFRHRLSYMTGEGGVCGEILYDSIHPLDDKENASILPVSKSSTASLDFEIQVSVSGVYRYKDSEWGNTDAEREYVDYKYISADRYEMEVEPGYIYLLDVSWIYAKMNAGSLTYSFWVKE